MGRSQIGEKKGGNEREMSMKKRVKAGFLWRHLRRVPLCGRMILQFPVFIDTFAPAGTTSPLNILDLDHEDLNWQKGNKSDL